MSQSAPTTAVNRVNREPSDDLDGGLLVSPSDILERMWRLFTSMRTALVLILVLAVLALIGTLLVQAPSGLQADAQAYRSWIETIRPKYGGWTGVMDTLQLFGIFSSIWFKGVMVLLTTSILACSVNRFRGLWKTAIRPRTKMTSTFYDRAPHSTSVAVATDADVALGAVRQVFGARHYRTVIEDDGEAVHIYADRFRWAPFGTLMAHISLVLMLVGALVGSTFGFRNSDFAAPIGTKVDIGNGTGMSIMAKSFTDTYNTENGSPSDYASDIVLYRGTEQLAAQTIRVNQPMQVNGITVYQSFYGPAAQMRVTDSSGKVVYDEGVPLAWGSNDKNKRVGQFALPDANLTVLVVGVASGEVDSVIKPGQMQLEVYKSGSEGVPVDTQVLSQGQPAKMAGLEFTFLRERQFTGLIVASDPGITFVWVGAILLVAGLFLVFFFPNRRIWARVRRDGDTTEIRLGATSRHDATFAPDFKSLADEMKLALAGPSVS